MIFHNRYLAITDIAQMGQYTFDNLEEWKDFAQRTEKGDIIIVGANFGSGSSRQQAVDCFVSLGIQAIIAKSFGAIYKRNAINSGFPILTYNYINLNKIANREEITIDLEKGTVNKIESDEEFINVNPFSQVQMDIYKSGNLFNYGKTLGNLK
ncbi:MAG: 3-isopropylmalate dehydratase [Candidatus Cloacimonadota bacterium]|nr:MAG: 3-isopropylmalate dehydratase [Candidatus Cloacimonadota bacterium]